MLTLGFANLPDGNPPLRLVWTGFSRTTWAGAGLPLELSFAGMLGCRLWTSIADAHPVLGSAWSFAIPNDARLVGRELYNQALVADPGANPFGATVTNAGAGRIGAR